MNGNEEVILDVTSIKQALKTQAQAVGGMQGAITKCQSNLNDSSPKSINVVHDADEEPSNSPRRESIHLSYSSSISSYNSRRLKTKSNLKPKRKPGLVCCVAMKIGKRHLPTP